MCGRFTETATPEQIEKEFNVERVNPQLFKPRYNIAPTQMIGAAPSTVRAKIRRNL